MTLALLILKRNIKIKFSSYYNINTLSHFLPIIPLWTVMAFRGASVGSDTLNYQNIFVNGTYSTLFSDSMLPRAPVYTIYSHLLAIFFNNPQAIIILNSTIIISIMMYCISKFSSNEIDSWYIYVTLCYYIFAFNAMRQGIAMAALLMCYCFMRVKNIKRAIIWLIIAIGIHQTAIIGIVIIIAMLKPISLGQTLKFTFILFLLEYFGEKAGMYFFLRIFPTYAGYTMGNTLHAGDSYTKGHYLALFFAIFIFWKIINMQINEKYKMLVLCKNPYFYNSVLLLTVYIIGTVIFKNVYYVSRLIIYFSQISIFLIPDILKSETIASNRILMKYISFPMMFIPYFVNIQSYLPYVFFWQ